MVSDTCRNVEFWGTHATSWFISLKYRRTLGSYGHPFAAVGMSEFSTAGVEARRVRHGSVRGFAGENAFG